MAISIIGRLILRVVVRSIPASRPSRRSGAPIEKTALSLQVVMVNGDLIHLDPSSTHGSPTAVPRVRMATAFGHRQCRITLLCDVKILGDDPVIGQAAPCRRKETGPSITNTAVLGLSLGELRKHVQLQGGDFDSLRYATTDWIDPGDYDKLERTGTTDGCLDRVRCQLGFPTPRSIDINMPTFAIGTEEPVSDGCHHYWPLVRACSMPQQEHGNEGTMMGPNSMYRITDKAPHETPTLQGEGRRQSSRVVTSGLSVWSPRHLARDVPGVWPDIEITAIIENKFADGIPGTLSGSEMTNTKKAYGTITEEKECEKHRTTERRRDHYAYTNLCPR